MEKDFRALGIDPHDVFKLGERKQAEALELLANELGISERIMSPLIAAMNIQKELAFSKKVHFTIAYNISNFFRKILLGS